MAPRSRTPNLALAGLMREGGIGNAQLARAVNRAAAELGVTLHYDKSSVSHWLKGSVPKKEARDAVAEALSRLLKRPVSPVDAGLGAGTDPDEPADIAAGVMDLGRADMDPSRRAVLGAGLYSAALVVPGFDAVAGRAEATPAGRTVRIGMGDIETVRKMTENIADILDDLGGAHARPMAAAFLVNTVGPYLKADGTEEARKAMRSAAADLVYLTGWMAMYEREHRIGQRYYVKALKLAGAAEDHLTYCRTLRGMALQASHLGHGAKSLELADSAAEAAPVAGPRLTAFLRGQQAHGAAMVQDRRQAFTRLRETEEALSQADGRNDHIGGYDRAAYEFHVAHVLWELGDRSESVRALRRSNRFRPSAERQGRLHTNGLLARRLLAMRHVEESCEAWDRFLDDYTGTSGARGDEHFATLRDGLRPYRQLPAVRQLSERAQEVARLKAA
ncbi:MULTISPECIES: hypothetical protein [Streptomyces]|uniref:Tat pathway signal protein n=2 Tax=Streptomyces nigrescens TaxID=1920 RepID=A0A640TI23_STRNI|nr:MULTISPECIES: hypothetical protein [Streptomyces]WAT97331.1 hypothetical protein STRLI_003258 [Streptomyces libani subsp. libani]WAU05268.1 hypothetical protein STRNI_003625 [Streptomyces nigrescens]WDT56924.1 hypothetical protein NUT86_24325 [Streptomyces sp. G7(2002)]GFE22814.1 hypothetical protein Sliba_32670 [Streptomyces libani subsp. libani]GGW06951.1 hypothetical protein GCM10010500_74650 [Streptomyces libani subsp. libani]